MSYVRFSDTSNVYVYLDSRGYIACCGCLLGDKWDFHTTTEAADHLREHIAAGHKVPDGVIEAIENDDEAKEFLAEEAK